mmetsp:Transcript_13713/g.49893  ORF Transcript_13713/g.49893 Transcript_13713/m.49893 type:complete len:341 (-) Transcript_13713:56-1078(-)
MMLAAQMKDSSDSTRHSKYFLRVLLSKNAAAAVFYGVMSISLTFLNKALLSEFKFDFPLEIVLGQCWTSVSCVILLKLCSIYNQPLLPEILSTGFTLVPLALVFSWYVVVSLIALRGLNVPMYQCLHHTSILLVMAFEYIFLPHHPVPSRLVRFAACLILSGAAIASARDLQREVAPLSAYITIFLAVILSTLYVVMIKRAALVTKLSSMSLLFWNSALTIPFLTAYVSYSGSYERALRFQCDCNSSTFQVTLSLVAMSGFLLQLSIFWNTSINSPSVQTVTGIAKNSLSFFFGLVTFNYTIEVLNFTGVCISFAGATLFAVSKYLDGMRAREARESNEV